MQLQVARRAIALNAHTTSAQYGATVHRRLADERIAKGLRRAGIATLRFNFRGTEGSEGVHHGAGLEEGDAEAALDFLAERHPGLPLWAAGFSFGARTVCGLAPREPRIARAIFVALPVSVYECDPITSVEQPSLLLFAGNDDFGTRTIFVERFGIPRANFDVQEIPGTDHFFRHKTPELEQHVRAWADQQLT